jgi:hypothetical protein
MNGEESQHEFVLPSSTSFCLFSYLVQHNMLLELLHIWKSSEILHESQARVLQHPQSSLCKRFLDLT